MKDVTKPRITAAFLCAFAAVASFLIVDGNSKIVWAPTLFFASIFLITMLRDVVITTGDADIGVNSIAVTITGAAVVFYTLDAPLSFILVLLVTAIYPPNIRERKWNYLCFNVANDLLGSCAVFATLMLLNFSIDGSLPIVLLKVMVAASSYELVTYIVLSIDSAIRGEEWRELLYDTKRSFVEAIPLAIFSGILGKFYFDFGPAMLLMFVVPLFFGRELANSYAKMQETQKSTLDTLTRTLEAKDKYTAGHVERVAKFAKYIGEELGYGPKRLERLRQAALLHDAGKLVVPSALLNKPGKLTDEEFKIIQRHEFVTIETLKSIDFLSSIAHTAGGDHNTMEGKSTKKLEPFIVAACDAFDAMTSTRSYRKALSMEIAFEELQKKGGKQFHPKVVEALIKAIESRGEHYGDGYETDIVHADAPEAGVGSAGIGDLASADDSESTTSENIQTAQEQTPTQEAAIVSSAHSIPSVLRTSVKAENQENASLSTSQEANND